MHVMVQNGEAWFWAFLHAYRKHGRTDDSVIFSNTLSKNQPSLTFHQIAQRGSSPSADRKMGVPAVIDISKEARPDGEVWESLSQQ